MSDDGYQVPDEAFIQEVEDAIITDLIRTIVDNEGGQ